jgi:hypothetical protein
MKKKLAIIGRGTAGSFALSHFMRFTDWDIDLYYDPNIPQQAVGEGANLVFPKELNNNINFLWQDLHKVDGTQKIGILKSGWGKGKEFYHNFDPPYSSIHFNAITLQNYILNYFKDNPRIKLIEENKTHDEIDSDFIMDCSGKPKAYEDFYELNSIPVNAVHVTQCYWDKPEFNYTLTIARPYGWVFGIPLQNRCSIGYMYNHKINTLDEVKEDVKQIFKDYNLTPSNTTNSFKFNNYYRKNNFTGRVAYNGNASFFLEPLEATSVSTMNAIQRMAFDVWCEGGNLNELNQKYIENLQEIEIMIMAHYYSGSVYNTPFWDMAKEKGKNTLSHAFKNQKFIHILKTISENKDSITNVGTWPAKSWKENIEGLGIGHILNGSLL